MFYVIKDNNLYEFGDSVNPAWDYPEEAVEFAGVSASEYRANPDKFGIENGVLVDISQTEQYLANVSAQEKAARKEEIQKALYELDMKCIRALREGGNDEDGTPFLEKYQAEIFALREEFNSL